MSDDYYNACFEKMQNSPDPSATIAELAALSLQDLPQMHTCKFLEQSATLFSVTCETVGSPTPELISCLQKIRSVNGATLGVSWYCHIAWRNSR